MSSGIAVAAKNYALDQLAANKWKYFSLHTADPGSSGTSEITGGSPAYARKLASWNAAASGALTSSATVNFDVPASTVAYLGLWDSLTGGAYGGKVLLVSATYGSQAVHPITSVSIDENATPSA